MRVDGSERKQPRTGEESAPGPGTNLSPLAGSVASGHPNSPRLSQDADMPYQFSGVVEPRESAAQSVYMFSRDTFTRPVGEQVPKPVAGGRNLAGRIRNIIKPQSKSLKELLGHALQGGDASGFIKALKTSGSSEDEVRAVLRLLVVNELEALHGILARAPSDPQTAMAREIVENLLTRVNPALNPGLQDALVKVVAQSAFAEDLNAYQEVQKKIAELLPSGPSEHEDCAVVAASVITHLLDKKAVTAEQVEAFLAALPANEMAALASAAADGAAYEPKYEELHAAANACAEKKRAGVRAELARITARMALDPDTNQLGMTEPAELADALIAADKLLGVHAAYSRASSNESAAALTKYVHVLSAAFGPLSNKASLEKFIPRTLKALDKAIANLGGDEACREAIAAALAKRKDAAAEAHAANARGLIEILQTPGKGAVDVLVAINHARSGHANSQAIPKRPFELELTELVRSLPDDQRRQLAANMNSPELRELRAAIFELGRMSVIKAKHGELCAKLCEVESILDSVRFAADPTAHSDSLREPPLFNSQSITKPVKSALKISFRIEFDEDGNVDIGERSGVAPPELQEALVQSLNLAPAPLPKLPGVRHVPRVSYVVGDFSDATNADIVAQQIKRLCQSDPRLAAALSNDGKLLTRMYLAANQAFDSMRRSLGSAESPVRLPDGSPIDLLGDIKAEVRIGHDPNVGLILRCELSIQAIRGKLLAPGAPSARVKGLFKSTCEIGLAHDGAAFVVEPLRYSNPVRLIPSWSEHPEPDSLDEIFEPDAPQAWKLKFREFAAKEHSSENGEFVSLVDSLSADDEQAMEEARSIADKYVRPSAETQVNLDAQLTADFLALVDKPGASVEQVRVKLSELRASLLFLTGKDTLGRFRRSEPYAQAKDEVEVPPPPPEAQEPHAAAKTTDSNDPRLVKIRGSSLNLSLATLTNERTATDMLDKQIKFLTPPNKSSPYKDAESFRQFVRQFFAEGRHFKSVQEKKEGKLVFANGNPVMKIKVGKSDRPLPLAQLALLRYRLESVISENLRKDEYAKWLLEVCIEEQVKRTGMTPEGLSLELGPPELNNETLITWFHEGRIGEAEVASYFRKLPEIELKERTAGTTFKPGSPDVEARQKIIEVARKVLAIRAARSEPRRPRARQSNPGQEFVNLANQWPVALIPQDLDSLSELARLFNEFNSRPGPLGHDARPIARNAQLVEQLNKLLEDFHGDALRAWTQDQLVSLLSSLETLGAETRAVQLALRASGAPELQMAGAGEH